MSLPADPAAPAGAPRRAVEALLAFWSEAGVDVASAPAPLDRLKPIAPGRPPPPPTAAPAAASRPAAAALDPHRLAAGVEAARAAASLAALAEALAAYEGCALRQGGAAPVFLRGDADRADVLVIGEAPGTEDAAAGAPFQGAAGRLAERMLGAAGLLDRALLVNTVFWPTPGGASPSPADQDACRPFLERAAALLRPRAVLILGASAARSVLRMDEPLLKLRGRFETWRGAHEALDLPALATFSPAFLLGQPAARKRAWGDLLTLAARVDPDTPAP